MAEEVKKSCGSAVVTPSGSGLEGLVYMERVSPSFEQPMRVSVGMCMLVCRLLPETAPGSRCADC